MNVTKEQLLLRVWSPKVEQKASMSSDEIDAQVAKYLAKGGRVKKLPSRVLPHTAHKAGSSVPYQRMSSQ